MAGFSTQVIIDADLTDHGWELVARFSAEDCIITFADVPTEQLGDTLGGPLSHAVEEAILFEMERG